jgi:hypothetical protein
VSGGRHRGVLAAPKQDEAQPESAPLERWVGWLGRPSSRPSAVAERGGLCRDPNAVGSGERDWGRPPERPLSPVRSLVDPPITPPVAPRQQSCGTLMMESSKNLTRGQGGSIVRPLRGAGRAVPVAGNPVSTRHTTGRRHDVRAKDCGSGPGRPMCTSHQTGHPRAPKPQRVDGTHTAGGALHRRSRDAVDGRTLGGCRERVVPHARISSGPAASSRLLQPIKHLHR